MVIEKEEVKAEQNNSYLGLAVTSVRYATQGSLQYNHGGDSGNKTVPAISLSSV